MAQENDSDLPALAAGARVELLRLHDELDRLQEEPAGSWFNLGLLVLMVVFSFMGLGMSVAALVLEGPLEVILLPLLVGIGFGVVSVQGGSTYLEGIRRVQEVERQIAERSGEAGDAVEKDSALTDLLPRESILKWSGGVVGGIALWAWSTHSVVQVLIGVGLSFCAYEIWKRWTGDKEGGADLL